MGSIFLFFAKNSDLKTFVRTGADQWLVLASSRVRNGLTSYFLNDKRQVFVTLFMCGLISNSESKCSS